MFKIGEFSRLVRVSARMLRHYEKCGLLIPAEIDRFTGYRYYGASQMPLLGRITALRDMGFGIAEIGDILQHFDDGEYMKRVYAEKARQLKSAIAGEQAKLERLEVFKDMMKKERYDMVYDVEIKDLPKVTVLALRETIPDYGAESAQWRKLGDYMAQNAIEPAAGTGGYSIYWDDEYKERDVDVEIAIPVDRPVPGGGGFACRELERIAQAATVRFSGPYENYSAASEKLAAWMEANGYAFAGPLRGMEIRAPHNESNPQHYMTELQVPVAKK